MTSTTGTDQHPEVSEISDLTEGLLTPSRTAEVRSHLAECELCAEVRDSLEEIQGLLSGLPDPEPMPEDIAARIDAALAAEAREADVSRETSTTETGEAPSGMPRSGSSPDRPAGRPRAATGPGRRPRRRLRAAFLGTACGAALIGMSILFLQNLSSSNDATSGSADRAITAEASEAPSFSQETLETTVQDLLAGGAGAKQFDLQKQSPSVDEQSAPEAETPGVETPEGTASKNPLSAPAIAVPPCVQQATGRTTPALALEEGTYQGQDAFLVVLSHPKDGSRVQAYVVAASCVDTAPESTGQLLHTQAYNRP
ncbi:anti-sigma factor family protein [Streptomyces sp. NPDC059452]|uniref:anti-sigma factor family protein n=1 Tax=Streptomyces sp. NPDC059452 TaxID=3346835 RepID=UPI0036C923DF